MVPGYCNGHSAPDAWDGGWGEAFGVFLFLDEFSIGLFFKICVQTSGD